MGLAEARTILLELLADYDFVTPGDQARALAGLISPALVFGGLLGPHRGALQVVEADDSQAGKGLFCQIVAAIYGSRAKTIARNDKGGGVGSLAESLSRAFLDGEPFIQIDNVRGALSDAFLEAAITESPIEARALRVSGSVDTSRTFLMLTSNKADLTPDLANRSNFIRINKRPDSYRFRGWGGSIIEHVRACKSDYLGAIFALIREWHRQGKPLATEVGHDFRRWSAIVRWIVMELLEQADPIADMRQIQGRVSSKAKNWLRDIVLAVSRTGRAEETLTATDLLELAIQEGFDVPGWRPGEDGRGDDLRMSVGRQQIGRMMRNLFGGSDCDQSVREGEWLIRRSSRQYQADESHLRPQMVYRVDPYSQDPPTWNPGLPPRAGDPPEPEPF